MVHSPRATRARPRAPLPRSKALVRPGTWPRAENALATAAPHPERNTERYMHVRSTKGVRSLSEALT